MNGDRFGPLYVTLLGTGLRLGEAGGLRWEDVDLERGTAAVRRALIRIPKAARAAGQARLAIAEPKTPRSVRTVPLPAFVVGALRDRRRRQLGDRLLAGSSWRESSLVFTNSLGGPIDPREATRHLQELLKRAGLPRMRAHDLRHAAASAMLARGVPVRVVMDILGHTNVQTTIGTYQHALPELADEAARRMDAFLDEGSATA